MNEKKFFKYIEKGNTDKVLDYIDKGFDINKRNELNEDAQTLAFTTNQFELAFLLLEKGADPFGYIFRTAIQNKDNELFDKLKPYLKFNEVSQRVHFPLQKAAQNGTFDQLVYLVDLGFQINYRDDFGRTALMYAVQNGDLEKTTFLLEKGSDLSLKSVRGYNVVRYLQKAELQNEEEFILLFIKHKIDIQSLKEVYKTFLIYSVQKEFYRLTTYLLERAYDIDEIDEYGKTALMYASAKANPKFVHLLLYFGANPFIQDNEKNKAISFLPHYDELMSFYLLKSAEHRNKKNI